MAYEYTGFPKGELQPGDRVVITGAFTTVRNNVYVYRAGAPGVTYLVSRSNLREVEAPVSPHEKRRELEAKMLALIGEFEQDVKMTVSSIRLKLVHCEAMGDGKRSFVTDVNVEVVL
jgi:hypothetical protein